MNPLYSQMQTTVFEAMSARARRNGAINLGQGFPDGPRPDAVLDAAASALHERSNQYPPMAGIPELRSAVAGFYKRQQGLDLAADEVIVTSGATEALAAALLALVSDGDEVLLFQPLYDAYLPLVRRAGGTARLVRLTPPHWRIERAALERAAGPRTKFLLLNDPLNPTGSLAHPDDLAEIARFCVERDIVAICDEVWEALVYDGRTHRSLMHFPGMRARTVKIGSAGKIFALTGWKVGWMCASAPIAQGLAKAHQFLTFTTPPNLQWAVAIGLDREAAWIDAARQQYQRSRDRLAHGLHSVGLHTLPSSATYFLTADLAASGIALDDSAFCDWLVDHAGVAAIPVSAFYADDPVRSLVRFCFAKDDATLDEALCRIGAALPGL